MRKDMGDWQRLLTSNGPQMLLLTERALRLSQGDGPEVLDALAAVLAEIRLFASAKQIIKELLTALRKRNYDF